MPSFLQRKILFVILIKIQRLRLCRNALTGIVGKFPAFTFYGNNAFFDAQHLLVIQFRTVSTVSAGFLHFLPKEHIVTLISSNLS